MFMIASMNFILCPTDNGDVECVRAALRVHGGFMNIIIHVGDAY